LKLASTQRVAGCIGPCRLPIIFLHGFAGSAGIALRYLEQLGHLQLVADMAFFACVDGPLSVAAGTFAYASDKAYAAVHSLYEQRSWGLAQEFRLPQEDALSWGLRRSSRAYPEVQGGVYNASIRNIRKMCNDIGRPPNWLLAGVSEGGALASAIALRSSLHQRRSWSEGVCGALLMSAPRSPRSEDVDLYKPTTESGRSINSLIMWGNTEPIWMQTEASAVAHAFALVGATKRIKHELGHGMAPSCPEIRNLVSQLLAL